MKIRERRFITKAFAAFWILQTILCFFPKGEGFAAEEKKARLPDKIEFVKMPDGREVIKITGQDTPLSEAPSAASGMANSSVRTPVLAGANERYGSVSLPIVNPSVTTEEKNGTEWFVLTTDNFFIRIEENEAFGVKIAETLEGFNLLLKEQMRIQNERSEHKLNLQIFKDRAGYDAFCREQQMDCSQTLGITKQIYAGRGSQYGFFKENRIAFYWDKDWRKLWDEREAAFTRTNFFETLFHEATHQLLNAYIPKRFPRWLGEGLAGYFENARFDGKEIYLPRLIRNRFAKDMKRFLQQGRKPTDVFSWLDKSGADESAYYGFSASFMTFLLRDPRHRNCLDELIGRIKEGVPAENIFDVVLKEKSVEFWKDWILFYQQEIALGS